ncbi:MAG TPA: sigma-54 dependent transcriptional regulator [Polyangiaceae bacterium]|nr:sigma-54 dependent transcriptional regulator [Polyangiaceae bacterium]
MARVLLVDDEPAVLYATREVLEEHAVSVAGSAAEALTQLDDIDVVVTDLSMPGMDGLELLSRVRTLRPGVPVILLTARGSERSAVQAMKAGAYDYLTKPYDVDELCAAVARAAELRGLRKGAALARAERALGQSIVAESPAMRRLLEAVDRVASRDVHVLVTGETGTGKEIIATLLHAGSPRASGPLIRFNAAAVPESLAEAELFGHERGAFTGATAARRGYFEQAHGGSLVLDEVGELPLGFQAKLLRAVQHGEVQRLGARAVERADVRIVACTHRDLRALVAEGRFREDLYYRLAVVELSVPALRERPEDIAPLARHFAGRFAAKFGLDDVSLSDELIRDLSARSWPGNVRELENTIARLVALSDGGPLGLDSMGPAPERDSAPTGSFRERVLAFERGLLQDALRQAGSNHSEAARMLGMSRITLLDKLKKHGLR